MEDREPYPLGKPPACRFQPGNAVVQEFDPLDIDPAPGNRIVTLEMIKAMHPSIARFGQRQPGVVYSNPEANGKLLLCAAGNVRLGCCRYLGIKFKALLVPGPVDELELIRIRMTENAIRVAATPIEIATDLADYIKRLGCRQAEAAGDFGFSAAKVAKLLSLLTLPAGIQKLVDEGALCQDKARIIASLPTPELQQEMAERVIRLEMKRDALEKTVATMRGGKRPSKARFRTLESEGAKVSVPGDWSYTRFAECLRNLIKKYRESDFPPGAPA